MALGDYVGSWIAHLVQESAKQASINNFPILTYSPISQINDEAPATFFLANLDKEWINFIGHEMSLNYL